MKCRASIGYLEADTPVLFQPDVLQEWPEELQINEQLLTLKKGACSKVVISVVNVSGHNVVIPGNMRLGDLELVTSVTPVEVRRSEANVHGNVKDEVDAVSSCSDVSNDSVSSCM